MVLDYCRFGKTKAEDEMREKLSNVTIGIMRLKSNICLDNRYDILKMREFFT